jgi:phage FluMu protein Com
MFVSAHLGQADRQLNVPWVEVRCRGCGRLLEKIEQYALRPGKRIEIKCGRCKVVNDLVGTEPR